MMGMILPMICGYALTTSTTPCPPRTNKITTTLLPEQTSSRRKTRSDSMVLSSSSLDQESDVGVAKKKLSILEEVVLQMKHREDQHVDNLQTMQQSHESHVQQLVEQLEQLTQDSKNENQSHLSEKNEWSKKMEDLSAQLKSMEKKNANTEQQQNKKKDEMTREEQSHLDSQIKIMQKEKEDLQEKLRKSQQISAEKDALQEQLEKSQEASKTAAAAIKTAMETAVSKEEDDIAKRKKDSQQFQTQLDALRKEKSELQSSLRKVELDLATERNETKGSPAENTDDEKGGQQAVEQKDESSDETIKSLRDQLQRQTSEYQKTLQAKEQQTVALIVKSKEEIQKLQAKQLKAMKYEHDLAVKELQEQLNDWKNQVSAKEEALQALTDRQQKDESVTTDQANNVRTQLKNKEKDMAVAKAQVVKLQQQVDGQAQELKENEEKIEIASSAVRAAESREQKLTDRLESLQQRLSEYQLVCSIQRLSLKSLEGNDAGLTEENENLISLLRKEEKKAARLERVVASLPTGRWALLKHVLFRRQPKRRARS